MKDLVTTLKNDAEKTAKSPEKSTKKVVRVSRRVSHPYRIFDKVADSWLGNRKRFETEVAAKSDANFSSKTHEVRTAA